MTSHNDLDAELAEFLSNERDRPLGPVTIKSAGILHGFSQAPYLGADNLLRKAARALDGDDAARAERLVERALQFPFDEHERVLPGWSATSMLVFSALTDVIEASPEDDYRWLDATLEVLAHCGSFARAELRHTLAAIAQDYVLNGPERRRLRAALGGETVRFKDRTTPPSSLLEQRSAVLEVLAAVNELMAALDHS